MPRDQRLYMTFPIGFDEHPKVAPLSDAAFRAFVEMNGYSRRNGLDGRIPVRAARAKWRGRALTELVESHPTRPLVLLEDDAYVIRDYAEHQFTTADLDDLHTKRAAAGAKGGAAKAAALAKQVPARPRASALARSQHAVAESGSESEESQDTHKNPPYSTVRDEDDQPVLDPVIRAVVDVCAHHGVSLHPLHVARIRAFIDGRRSRRAAPPKIPVRYYPSAVESSWLEVEKLIFDEGLAS